MLTKEQELELIAAGAKGAQLAREQQGVVPDKEERPVIPEWRTKRCQRCQQIYDEKKPRTQSEIERLHQTLCIGGAECNVELSFCDICYIQVVETVTPKNNNSSFDVGSNNNGPVNWLLRHTYR